MKKPGQPIQVKDMLFLQPERAETRPPEDILKWYSPAASLVMVMGRRLETTMRCAGGPARSRVMESLRVGDMARKACGGCGRAAVVAVVGEDGEDGECTEERNARGRWGPVARGSMRVLARVLC